MSDEHANKFTIEYSIEVGSDGQIAVRVDYMVGTPLASCRMYTGFSTVGLARQFIDKEMRSWERRVASLNQHAQDAKNADKKPDPPPTESGAITVSIQDCWMPLLNKRCPCYKAFARKVMGASVVKCACTLGQMPYSAKTPEGTQRVFNGPEEMFKYCRLQRGVQNDRHNS